MSYQNPRLYYVGDQNMVQSVVEASKSYSMKFEKQQMSQSKNKHEQILIKQNKDTPIFLGEQVYNIIKERYKQIKKMETIDPEVLNDFYLSIRKQNNSKQSNGDKLKQKLLNSKNFAASSQRKLLTKLQFEKYLTYKPSDIYYTLLVQAAKLKKDKQLEQQIKKKQYMIENFNEEPSKKLISNKQTVERLYPQTLVKPVEQNPKEKQHIQNMSFVFNLIKLYKDRSLLGNVKYNTDILYNFWIDLTEKEQHGLKKRSQQVRPLIKEYFIDQIENLIKVHQNKKGFRCYDKKTLAQFYKELKPEFCVKEGINIDDNCIDAYLYEYNQKQKQLQKKKQEEEKKKALKKQQQQKKMMLNTLGRPSSATPLSILSQPKYNNDQYIKLAKQFPKDKTLQKLLMDRIVPHARHAQQYGVFSPEQEIKIKARVVMTQKGKNPDKQIEKMLMKSTFEGLSLPPKNIVRSLLEQQYLEDQVKWKKLHLTIRDALQIQSYREEWVRDALLSFGKKYMSQDFIELDTNAMIDKIITHLSSLSESARKNKIAYLRVELSQQESKFRIKERAEENKKQDQVRENKKEQRQFYIYLQAKAQDYVKQRLMTTSEPNKQTRMNCLKAIYEDCKKMHKNYIQKHFPVINSNLPYSHLFKYEFYRLVKQINPLTLERDKKPKNHIWAPNGTSKQINQQTFNRMVQTYSKDKSKAKNDNNNLKKDTVWNKKYQQERQKFLMTFEEAKQCTFKPVIHKI